MTKFLLLTVGALVSVNAAAVMPAQYGDFGLGPRQMFAPQNQEDLKAQEQKRMQMLLERQGILNTHAHLLAQFTAPVVEAVITREEFLAPFKLTREVAESSRNQELASFKKELLEAGKAFGLDQKVIDEVTKTALEQFNALAPNKKNFNVLRVLIGRLLASKVTDKRAFGAYWKKNHAKIVTFIAFGKLANLKILKDKEAREFSRLVDLVLKSKGKAFNEAHAQLVKFFNEKKESIVKALKENVSGLKNQVNAEKLTLAELQKNLTLFINTHSPAAINADKALQKELFEMQKDVKDRQDRVAYLENVLKELEETAKALESLTPELLNVAFSKEALSSGVKSMVFSEAEEKAFAERIEPLQNFVNALNERSAAIADQIFWNNPEQHTLMNVLKGLGKTDEQIHAAIGERNNALLVANRLAVNPVNQILAGNSPMQNALANYADALQAAHQYAPQTFALNGFLNPGNAGNVQTSLTTLYQQVAALAARNAITPEQNAVLNALFGGYNYNTLAQKAVIWSKGAERDARVEEGERNSLYTFYKAQPEALNYFNAEHAYQYPRA